MSQPSGNDQENATEPSSDDQGQPRHEPVWPKRRWRRRWLSLLLLGLGLLMLAGFLAWPLYAPSAIRWGLAQYAPPGWSMTIGGIDARYRATRLTDVSMAGPFGIQATGLTIDVVHARGLLTRDLSDVGMRISGGTVSIADPNANAPQSDDAVALPERLSLVANQPSELAGVQLPGTAILPLGSVELAAITLQAPGGIVGMIDGAGRRADTMRLTLETAAPARATARFTWQADSSVDAELTSATTDTVDAQPISLTGLPITQIGAVSAGFSIPQGALSAAAGRLRITDLVIETGALPVVLAPLVQDGVEEIILERTVDDDWALEADFGQNGRVEMTGTPTLPGQEATEITLPLVMVVDGLRLAGITLERDPEPLVLTCCDADTASIATQELGLVLAHDQLTARFSGPLEAQCNLAEANFALSSELLVAGLEDAVAGARSQVEFTLTGSDDRLDYRAEGSIMAWPANASYPVISFDTVGRVADQVLTGQGRIALPSMVSCSIPDDHIAPRRSALFLARSVLEAARDGGGGVHQAA